MNYCEEYAWLVPYFNICDYTPLELIIILIGTILWCITYIIIVKNGFKNKFVEMPVAAASANVAWEFTWAYLTTTDLGIIFIWGLKAWFFLDLFIIYLAWKYGAKQLESPILIKYFKPIFVFGTIVWTIMFYLFIQEGYDTSMGSFSAYLIMPPMAFWYTMLFSSINNPKYFSYQSAWFKMLGSALMGVYVFMHYEGMLFMKFLVLLSTFLDIVYIIIFYQRLKEQK